MFQADVPPSIVIDEAIGISKEFGTGDSFRFVNGVLDSIRRTLAEAQIPPGAQVPANIQTPADTPESPALHFRPPE
jgi:N utilization substance protein B